jgi:hypothetical protein
VAKSKKQKDLPVSRKRKRGPPGPSPFVVVAGLPEATAQVAAATINNADDRWRAVAGTFPSKGAAIYESREAITDLLGLACAFMRSNAREADGAVNPSRIAVAYVPADGSERLWDAFGHSVWPIPLALPAENVPRGRHWRFDIETVNMLLARALRSLETGFAEAVRLRLEARHSDEVLMLPGRNFHTAADERLASRYRAFLRGDMQLDQVGAGVQLERFAYERLPEYYRRMGGRGKRFAVDRRGLVFAKSNYGQHGSPHEIAAGRKLPQPLLRRELESRFRFGTPLEPPGFQHDVQWESGEKLVRERFDCTNKGTIEVSGDHANAFPNDVVTADKVRRVKG